MANRAAQGRETEQGTCPECYGDPEHVKTQDVPWTECASCGGTGLVKIIRGTRVAWEARLKAQRDAPARAERIAQAERRVISTAMAWMDSGYRATAKLREATLDLEEVRSAKK